jgi:exonuclease SbcC
MKILNIHFKNINSLEGEHSVDFELAPFTDTGVFAITGPNGSGKSSILDVITLGLYGETFRFNRPADHVMTQHTNDCYATIEFSIDGEKYRSNWSAERTTDDDSHTLLPIEMNLYRYSDGKILAQTPQQVCTQVADITGMNFRSFTRSILLAQGDFSAFLNALDNERMDILERIIGSDIYADYKKELLDNANKAQKTLDRLKQELDSISFMDADKLDACEQDLNDFTEQLTELRDDQHYLEQQLEQLTAITTIETTITDQENDLKMAYAQLGGLQLSLTKLSTGQDAILFKDDINAISEIEQLIQQGQATLSDFQIELSQLKAQLGSEQSAPEGITLSSFNEQQQTLDKIKAQLSQSELTIQNETAQWQSFSEQYVDKQATLTQLAQWLEDHAVDEGLLSDFPEIGVLKKCRVELLETNKKQTSFGKYSKKALTTFKNNTSSLTVERQKQAELDQKIPLEEQELIDLAEGHSTDDLDAVRLEQLERVKDLQQLYQLAQKHQKLTTGGSFFSLFKAREQPDFNIEALSIELERLRLEMLREANIKKVIEDSIANEALLKKMASSRVHLIDGKPCALCGALQHPYAKFPPTPSNSKQALIDQKAKVRALTEKISTTDSHINIAKKQVERNSSQDTQRQQIRAQWLSLCNRLNVASPDLDITKLALMQELIQKENDELANTLHFIKRYRDKQTDIKKSKTQLANCTTTIEQLQVSIEQLSSSNEGLTQEQLDIASALSAYQEQERQLTEKVLTQLTILGEKMPSLGQEDILFDKLNVRRQDYHGYAFRYKSLTEELASLEAQQTACQAEVLRCNELSTIYTEQLKKQELISLHLGLIEKQKLIADKEQVLAKLKQEIADLKRHLQEKLLNTSFTSLEEISNILTIIANQADIEHTTAALDQHIDALNRLIADNQNQLATELANIDSALSLADLNTQLKSINEKIDISEMETKHLQTQLEDQVQLQQRYEEVSLQWQQQVAISQPYFAEIALFATENNSMAFRRRVQQRIADQLLSQTNALLEKISGRYYLRKGHSEQGLALEIEDTYQANVRRLPKSLSGGESFIVSLALALGLSELANNGRSVDSLFLDEGFGNLDADALYTVISTLEGLQTYGKTVGVISHVEAVQKRIKAQLQVVKKANGMGELKKVS